MPWIDEMLSRAKENKIAADKKRRTKKLSAGQVENSEKQIHAGKRAWAELLSAMRNDVNEFNNNKSRVGHSPVLMTSEASALAGDQFEVYVPEMSSRLLVLTLTGNNLHIVIRPEFPEQPSTITLSSTKNIQNYCWMLGGVEGGAQKELSAQQLSELLLRSVLSSAETD
jgi:hypothetical protein